MSKRIYFLRNSLRISPEKIGLKESKVPLKFVLSVRAGIGSRMNPSQVNKGNKNGK